MAAAGGGDGPLGSGLRMAAPPPTDVAARPPAVTAPPQAPERRRDWRPFAAAAVVALFVALPLRALFQQNGSPMEEGFMLTFPERVLAGDVANRDFLHLYGPGGLWVLAAVYQVFGVSLAAERVVGLLQHLALIFGVLVLAWPFGRRVATICGVLAVFITVTPIGLTALAWSGGAALALCGLVAGLHGRRLAERDAGGEGAVTASTDGAGRRGARWLFVVAGVLGAAALLYRPDLILAVGLAYATMAWRLERSHLVRLLAPMAALVLVGYGVHALMAGPENALRGMLLDPVFELRGGRRLPAPPSWDHLDGALAAVAQLVVPDWPFPAPDAPKQVVLWFWLLPVAAVFEVLFGAWRLRAEPSSWKARVLLAAGLLGLGMMPQALQRPDTTHLAWVSAVPLSLLPMYLAELVPGRRGGGRRVARVALAAGTAVVLLFGIFPYFTARSWTELTRQTFEQDYTGLDVRRGDRNFYLGSEPITPAAQAVVDELGRRARPGERLFVGPADLRKTPYSDAYLYFLFPELPPATRYIEMDPGIANAEGSGLAEDVASADWLILSHVWDNFDEPNDVRKLGSNAPNEVVERDFCLIDEYGTPDITYFLLYQRCR